jgi:hypothetical protein
MKILKLLLFIVMISITILSCRKGEGDPFLSLRTRKARITGEWKLKSGSITTKENDTTIYTLYNGVSAETASGIYPYTEKFWFKKDGSFRIIYTNSSVSLTFNGLWRFGKRIKEIELKNKEYIILMTTSKIIKYFTGEDTETYTGTSCPIDYLTIKELRNNELTIIHNGTDTWPLHSSIISGSLTYIQDKD